MSVVEFGGMVNEEDVNIAELYRGMGRKGQIMTLEDSTSMIQLDQEFESDILANALIEAARLGVEFASCLRHITTREGVAALLIETLDDYGMDEIASYWEGNLYEAA